MSDQEITRPSESALTPQQDSTLMTSIPDIDFSGVPVEETINLNTSRVSSTKIQQPEKLYDPLPTYIFLFPQTEQLDSNDVLPDYDSIFYPETNLPNINDEIATCRIPTRSIFYSLDIILTSFLIYITVTQFTNVGLLWMCGLTIFTSYFSVFCNILKRVRLVWGSYFILSAFIVRLIFQFWELNLEDARRSDEVMLNVFAAGYVFSLVFSLNFFCKKKDLIEGTLNTLLMGFELIFSVFPLVILLHYKYIHINTLFGLAIAVNIFLIIYISLDKLFKNNKERKNMRMLLIKDILVYYVFVVAYFLSKVIFELGEEVLTKKVAANVNTG